MTNYELHELIEKNSQAIRELKDSLTVEASLNSTRERQYSQAFLEHQEWLKGLDRRLDAMTTISEGHHARMADLDSRLDAMTTISEGHHARMADLDARLDRIAALIERFLQGRERNGHQEE